VSIYYRIIDKNHETHSGRKEQASFTRFTMTDQGDTKRTLPEVLQAIKGSGGIKMTIARRLGITRPTLDKYIGQWKSAAVALQEEEENGLDVAESVIKGNIQAAAKLQQQTNYAIIVDSGDAKWYLSRKGRHRGYVERQEVTGAAGDSLQVVIRYADNRDNHP
jgi:hypothetical protein